MRKTIAIETKGELDFIDITDKVADIVAQSGVKEGLCHLFIPGSTAGILINEHDSSLLDDFRELFQQLTKGSWRHPSNASSHLLAGLIGPEKTIPVKNASLQLGTWQQIFLVEFDVRPRSREVIVTVR